MFLECMWKNLLESYFLAKNCFETLRLIGPHLDDPLEAAAMTTSSSSSYKILKPMKSMEDQAKNDDQHGQWWKEVPDGPQGQQGEEQERQVGCRLVFQNYSFDFKQAVLEKNAVQNSSMEWWKMQTFTQRKVEKQAKCRVYRNVSECIGQKNGVIHV